MNPKSLLAHPTPVSNRISILYAEYGSLELDGHSVVLRRGEIKTHFPVGSTTVICVEPGTVVTHAAVKACSESGCMMIWTGEAGVRCYAVGNPGGAVSQNLLAQAALHLDPSKRLFVARKIFSLMFDCDPPAGRSIDQLRGIEGSKVRALYPEIASRYGVQWNGRDQKNALSDPLNRCISGANAALYGVVEAAIVALGYSPAIGFVHSGDVRSFVFDVADIFKFITVVPATIELFSSNPELDESGVRRLCRDIFRKENLIARIVSTIELLMSDDG